MQAILTNSKEKATVTHRICPYVYDALKRYAADHNVSIQKTLEKIITSFLEKERESYLAMSRKAFGITEEKKKFTRKSKKS